MNYIVLDLEWNQPYSKVKKHSHGVEICGEIIQFGAIRLDNRLNIVDSFKVDVKPRFYKKINRHVSAITGLTEKTLDGCPDFKTAYEAFCEFCGDDYCILTWGSDDVPILIDNLRAYGMKAQMPLWLNLQIPFNVQVSHEYRQCSLKEAMEMMDIEQNLTEHDAFCDACNTAKLLARLDFSGDIERYRGLEFMTGRKIDLPDTYGYKTLRDALSDKAHMNTPCPVCNKQMQILSRKVFPSSRIIEAKCKKHGSFRYRITASKHDDTFTAHRKMGIVKEEPVAVN